MLELPGGAGFKKIFTKVSFVRSEKESKKNFRKAAELVSLKQALLSGSLCLPLSLSVL